MRLILVSVFAALLAGCAATIPPGPTFRQQSDAGTTELTNQPPGALGIREEGVNWAATGASNVKAVRVNEAGVLQLGSGPATRQVFWNPSTNAFVLSSETDFKVAHATVYGQDGKPLYDVQGFETSTSTPTTALAGNLKVWGDAFIALSADQKELVISAIKDRAAAVQAVAPTAGNVLSDLVKALAGG